jgi:hypothetical protein
LNLENGKQHIHTNKVSLTFYAATTESKPKGALDVINEENSDADDNTNNKTCNQKGEIHIPPLCN